MRIHHVALIASDYAASKKFYTEVLNLQIISETHRPEKKSWKCDLADQEGRYLLELFSFPDPPARPSQPEACGLRHLAFAVEDIDAIRQEFSEKGVHCEDLRLDTLTMRQYFFIKDPDGLPLEFYEIDPEHNV